ncbi:MAG: hypothetical protein ACTSWX_16670 [Promethearchaeota archaeon]
MSKVGFVLCVCTGDCPGFATMNVWDLINQVRLALPVEWAIVHPQLCEIDGDRFVQNLIQLIKENQIKYFIAGCSPNMQRKLIGHHFKEVGMDFKEWVMPLDVRNMTTDQAFDAIEKQLDKWGVINE